MHYNEVLFQGFRIVLCFLLCSPGGKGGGGWLAKGSVMPLNLSPWLFRLRSKAFLYPGKKKKRQL